MEVVLDGISPPSFWYFPGKYIWVKVIDFSYFSEELYSNIHFARRPYWLSRSSIVLFERFVKTRYLRGSILKSRLTDQIFFRSNGNIGFWFQECLSFPKIYLVTTLHKIRTNVFFLT